MSENFHIRFATKQDTSLILNFIKELAEYEKLSHEVLANEAILAETLFGDKAYAEVILAYHDEQAVGFTLFFHNFSTFLGRPGIYLEDLFIKSEFRGKAYGKALLAFLANLTLERQCGRLEWSVLDWNKNAIDFYKSLGAVAMDEWSVFRVTEKALHQLASQNKLTIS